MSSKRTIAVTVNGTRYERKDIEVRLTLADLVFSHRVGWRITVQADARQSRSTSRPAGSGGNDPIRPAVLLARIVAVSRHRGGGNDVAGAESRLR